MIATVYPGKISGTIPAIPSKSHVHRLLICASLAAGKTNIACPVLNEDIEATARCLMALKADISYSDGIFRINPDVTADSPVLDCGESDFAYDIAHLALNIWKREVDESYYTFEMVNTVTGCGGWFHNFGGLSTPINMWAKAYYCPGKVNVGFDTYLDKVNFNVLT